MNPWMYLGLNALAFFFPLVLSFDQKVHFVRHWRHLFIAIVVIGVPYLVWDYFFTEMGVWGFNPDYLSGLYLTNLPLGELLFFVVVPFACMFIYECTKAYFPGLLFRGFNTITYALLSLYALFVLIQGWGNWYSTCVAALCLVLRTSCCFGQLHI